MILERRIAMKLSKMAARTAALIMCVVTAVTTVNYSFAVTVSEAQAEKNELENKRNKTSQILDDLESDKSDIVAYIKKLDTKMTDLSVSIREIKEKIKEKKSSIKELAAKIAESEIEIKNQYETMKKRIKYMYEKGNSEYIDILLASDGLSDFLNKSEYIGKISEYDSTMLYNYNQAKTSLEEKKTSLEEKNEILEESKKELESELSALDKISSKKNAELANYNDNIAIAQNQLSEYDNELVKQEKIIEDALLEEQKRIAAEEARKKQEEEARKKAEAAKAAANKATNAPDGQTDNTQAAEPTEKPQTTVSSSAGFIWPLPVSGKITSYFGSRTSPTAGASSNHQGIDISAPAGTSIRAAKAGTVVTASYSSGAGNYIMINHGDGLFTVYMHCSSLAVSKGQQVSAGTTIGYVGSTGISTGNHLHFGVSVNGSYVDPLGYVSQ